jgi:hypothetical protein
LIHFFTNSNVEVSTWTGHGNPIAAFCFAPNFDTWQKSVARLHWADPLFDIT